MRALRDTDEFLDTTGGDSSLIMVAGAGFERHLPFATEVTLVLPSMRGVREGNLVPAALAGMYYVDTALPRQSEASLIL